MFRRCPEHLIIVLFFNWILIDSVLNLLLYGPRIRINYCSPGNIGNLIFLYFWTPGNIGNLSLQHSPESWKYYPNPEPTPNPKPISLLGPGPDSSGEYGRTRTRAAGASRNPTPLGGLRPPRPPVGFFRDGRGPASYFVSVIFYGLMDHNVCNILQNPGNIGNRIFMIFSHPGNTGNPSLQHSPDS